MPTCSKFSKIVVNANIILFIVALLVVLTECFSFTALHFLKQDNSRIMQHLIAKRDSAPFEYFAWSDDFFNGIVNDFDPETGQEIYQYEPYAIFVNAPNDQGDISVGKDGFRKTAVYAESEGKTVALFGGSTMYCANGPDELTIASLLARHLNLETQESWEVKNYGVSGYSFDQELVLFTQRLLAGERPDHVIFYDGINDVINKISKGQPHYLYGSMVNVFAPDRLERNIARYASIFLHRHLNTLKLMDRLQENKTVRKVVAKDRFKLPEKVVDQRVNALVERFNSNLEFLEALSKQYGFSFHVLLQPSLFTTGKPLGEYESEQLDDPARKSIREHLVKSYAALLQGVHSEHFVNLSGCLDSVQEDVFTDYCHVTPIAYDVVARNMFSLITGKTSDSKDDYVLTWHKGKDEAQ